MSGTLGSGEGKRPAGPRVSGLGLTLLLIMLGLAAAAACSPDSSTGSQTSPDCDVTLEECREHVRATVMARPTPTQDPIILEIVLRDPVFRQIVDGRELGVDYWLKVNTFEYPAHGDRGGMVTVAFREPASYEGDVPTASDPCAGHYGDEHPVRPDDPCLTKARVYGTASSAFSANVVHFEVEIGRGAVVNVFPDYPSQEILDWMISNMRNLPESQPPATPTVIE